MKTLLTIFILLLTISASAFSGDDKESVIILEGKYQQRNIYIAQAIGSEGFGYCAYEIRVNGSIITDAINSSAFEIDLSPFNFKLGDEILIEIRHKSGCTPKILNPGGLKPKPTFNTVDIKIDENQILEWITEDEYGSLPFIIQQYKWNKWVNLGEVKGEGMPTIANYAFYVDLTSGINKFRVIQIDQSGRIKKSKSVELESTKPALTQTYNKKSKKVIFSSDTGYEIHNKYGELISKGYGSEANVKDLVSDNYWLSFDNTTVALKK